MKFRQIIIGSLIVLIFNLVVLFVSCKKSNNERWELFWESNSNPYYIDMKSISYPSTDIARAWIKYNEEIKNYPLMQEALQQKAKELLGKENGINFSFENLTLYEIDCRENRVNIVTTLFYKEQEQLVSFDYPKKEWEVIIPETFTESIQDIICKK